MTAKSDILDRYIDALFGAWPDYRRPAREEGDELLRCLGDGIINYLQSRIGEYRLLTKTPSVQGLERFYKLFPDACLIILVRDGRALVESHRRTFGSTPERITRQWAEGADKILEFDRRHRESARRYLIVRYEDLYARPREELNRIFEFLGLNADSYDFAAIEDQPVIGSSTERGDGTAAVHWRPVERTESFDPIGRAGDWSTAQHRRFNYLAGPLLKAFGYEPRAPGGAGLMGNLWNRALDARWALREMAIGLLRRTGLYRTFRDARSRAQRRSTATTKVDTEEPVRD